MTLVITLSKIFDDLQLQSRQVPAEKDQAWKVCQVAERQQIDQAENVDWTEHQVFHRQHWQWSLPDPLMHERL